MTVIDILFRVDSICKKYQRYDVEKKRELNAHVEDAFGLLYAFMKAEIDAAVQDQGLDFISEGLDTLKNLAQDMNEEIDWQVPPIDEMDTKVDKGTSDLKNTNVRLKETLVQLRSS